MHVDKSVGSQVSQVIKLAKTLERASDSSNNRTAFRPTGLMINPLIFPPVASVGSAILNDMIDSFAFPDTAEENESSGDEGRHPALVDFGFLGESTKHSLNSTVF
jgi:hypothetical protein